VYDAIYVEGKGKPATFFVFEYFQNDAASAASSKGMPVIRVVPSRCFGGTDLEESSRVNGV
jgi:hypothetical protein